MSDRAKSNEKGSATLEYAILLPVVFACVIGAILAFLIYYQKAIIQSYAEKAAQSLSRQWGYKPLPMDELESGVYSKTAYEAREIYWHLKIWNNGGKEKAAEEYLNEKFKNAGLLKAYDTEEENIGNLGFDPHNPVKVTFKPGLPSTLYVDIRAGYILPCYRLLRLFGFTDCIIIEGHAQALVYDAKDMINTTDYIVQLVRGTETYQKFMEKISPLKNNLQKLIGQ